MADQVIIDSKTYVPSVVASAEFTADDRIKLNGIEELADVTDTTNVSSSIAGATTKASIVDADTVTISDSASSNTMKRVSFSVIKSTLKTYFDTLYNNYVHPNHTGDVTSVADGATTISPNVVSNTKLADVPTNTIKGRVTSATGDPEDLTPTQVRTMINVADGANNYVHPSTHSPSIIAQDASNRFVTDAEKSTWNSKASTSVATTTTNGLMSSTDKTKLDGVESGADVNNISDANATDLTDAGDTSLHYHSADRSRSNHTGTQSADTIVDGTTNKVYTATEKTKLAGIATGATANDTDANLKNRANHTGTQTASTISDFDVEVSNNIDVTANTSARHTHLNKAILDATTASFLTADKNKLNGISTGANKVQDSTTNGNILIDSVETNVYTHPSGTNPHGTTKADLGLENVDNTSDFNKPISTATQTALNLKAPLASPSLTGTPTAPTATVGTNTTQIATTEFVQSAMVGVGAGDMAKSVYDTNNDGIVDNSDKLDGKHASEFFYANAPQVQVDPNSAVDGVSWFNGSVNAPPFFPSDKSGTLYQRSWDSTYITQFAISLHSQMIAVRTKTGGTWNSWSKVWNDVNDGSGSGLDADLLDGIDSTGFFKRANLGGNGNANTVLTQGSYRIDAGWTNMPAEAGAYGSLTVFGGVSDTCNQIYCDYSLNRMWMRGSWNYGANWTAWRQLTSKYGTTIPTSLGEGEVYYVYE
jgi:hypothetical protein